MIFTIYTTTKRPNQNQNQTTMKRPSIPTLAKALTRIKQHIDDDMREMGDDLPGIDVTLACDENGYALQTGDNSFTGPAYSHKYWGVGRLYRRTNARNLARELIDQCLELADV